MSITPVELGRFEPRPDVLVLAALERAQRHHERGEDGVRKGDIAWHLGFKDGSWTSRHLRPQLDGLEADGLVLSLRLHGYLAWKLTDAGRLRVEQARRTGDLGELPESPQHRAWRHARAAAEEEITELRRRLRAVVAEAGGYDVERCSSDAWFAIGAQFGSVCRSLGSATYCLREWPEPDDAHPDIDDRRDPNDVRYDPDERAALRYRRQGRRNTASWR